MIGAHLGSGLIGVAVCLTPLFRYFSVLIWVDNRQHQGTWEIQNRWVGSEPRHGPIDPTGRYSTRCFRHSTVASERLGSSR